MIPIDSSLLQLPRAKDDLRSRFHAYCINWLARRFALLATNPAAVSGRRLAALLIFVLGLAALLSPVSGLAKTAGGSYVSGVSHAKASYATKTDRRTHSPTSHHGASPSEPHSKSGHKYAKH